MHALCNGGPRCVTAVGSIFARVRRTGNAPLQCRAGRDGMSKPPHGRWVCSFSARQMVMYPKRLLGSPDITLRGGHTAAMRLSRFADLLTIDEGGRDQVAEGGRMY